MVKITLDSTSFNSKMSLWDKATRKKVLDFIAASLEDIRTDAADFSLIPNRTGFRNPYYARMFQGSTPGMLTQRTGKMAMLLKEKLQEPFTGELVREKNTTALQIKAYKGPKSASHEYYRGQIRLDVKNTLPGFMHYRGKHPLKGQRGTDVMPKETPLTVKFRFLWENRQRPYLNTAVARVYPKVIERARAMASELTLLMK